MFFLQYPCSEAFGVILIVHRNNGLDDDRPRIHPFIGKMDGTSRKLDSIIDSLLLDVHAGERRQKRWMNVHDPPGKCPKKFSGKNSHETGHNDQLYTGVVQEFDHSAVTKLPGREFAMIDHDGRYPMFPASFEGEGVGIVAEYKPDFRIQRSLIDMVNQGLKIGAVSRNENADGDFFHHARFPTVKKEG